jgi:hypothetical protein
MSKIVKQPSFNLSYLDYITDIDTGRVPGSQVQRLFNVQLAKVRSLYILPFLDSIVGHCPAAYQSIVSSAPNTVTPCRLKNLNIQIGGSNIFVEPQSYTHQFYTNQLLPQLSALSGNAMKAAGYLKQGQITREMWESGYGVYQIDLKKVADESQDALAKSFQISYQIEGGLKNMQFLYIIEYECSLQLDRSTGEIVPA